MTYNPDKHNRRSIRLKDYDYSAAGAYYITMVTHHRECFFGEVVDNEMLLNDAGKMLDKWWCKLQEKFSGIELDEYVIMPNHFHGIIIIANNDDNVGAIPRNRPDENAQQTDENKTQTGENTVSPLHIPNKYDGLGRYISWFKRMTTNEYIRNVKQNDWQAFDGKLWQRNYYEHIIRDEAELNKKRDYITSNPLNWKTDENHI